MKAVLLLVRSDLGAIHLWRPHGGGGRGTAQVVAYERGRGVSSTWTSTQKIRAHWRHTVAVFYQNFVFGQNIKWKLFFIMN